MLWTWLILISLSASIFSVHTVDSTITVDHFTPSLAYPRLIVPSITVSSPIATFYLDGNTWAIDPWEESVGHLEGTQWLGTTGNIVLAGHSEYPNGTDGIFAHLDQLAIGDLIWLGDTNIQQAYRIIEVKSVNYLDLSVVYPTQENRLTLITCDIPSYDPATNTYDERLVIVAQELP